MVTIHENIEDYTIEEKVALQEAYDSLEMTAQAGELTIDETRIRVAYIRLKREENFKISVIKEPKAPKVPKPPKEPGQKRTRTKKVKEKDSIELASELFFKRMTGEILTPDEEKFLEEQDKLMAIPLP